MGRTNGNLALKRTITVIPPIQEPDDLLLRVAAYCRVSSDSSDQLNSFAAQVRHFTDSIQEHKNWKLVDIYADEGITGTSIQKRDEFHRLMEDCRKGRIDKVLVKSISRFARNSEDLLSAIRELKAMGIGVFFEEQNIDSKEASGETLLAILAACAQSESESISKNCKGAIRHRMESGNYLPSMQPYGYCIKEGKIEIVEEEAAIVREIYGRYLAGENTTDIADLLNKRGILRKRSEMWTYHTVLYILTNEKYLGNSLWQKTYTTDSFPSITHVNKGERKKYYAEGTHEAIISKEVFRNVQALVEKRYGRLKGQIIPIRSRNAVGMCMECGSCGNKFRMKNIRGSERQMWICKTHVTDPKKCQVKPVSTEILQSVFLRLYYNLKHDGYPILIRILQELEESRYHRMLWHPDVIALNKRISELSNQSHSLAQLHAKGIVDPGIFVAQSNKLAEQLRQAKKQKMCCMKSEVDETILATKVILENLDDGPDYMEAFDEELFCELVEKIIVDSNDQVRFCLKNGWILTEKLI